MSRPKRNVDSPDARVREVMLRSAAEIFNRKGYAAATVREIVGAAGVSKPVLYYYFGNKEGIYLDLIRESFGRLDLLLEELDRKEGTAAERLLWLCDQAFALAEASVEQIRLMHAIYYGPPQGAPFFDFNAHHVKLVGAVERLVIQGIEAGEFRDQGVEAVALAVLGAVNVAIEVLLRHPEVNLGRAGLSRILDVIFEGIAVKAETA